METIDPRILNYINNYYQNSSKELEEFRSYCEKNHIPLIKRETESFLINILKLLNPKRILEIGTGAGYSSTVFAKTCADTRITTLEMIPKRIEAAILNFEKYGISDRIELIEGDASESLDKIIENIRPATGNRNNYINTRDDLTEPIRYSKESQEYSTESQENTTESTGYSTKSQGYSTESQENTTESSGHSTKSQGYSTELQENTTESSGYSTESELFDFVFIDCAKSRYREFFTQSLYVTQKNGVIICDNILLGGRTTSDDFIKIRRDKTSTARMREFVEYLKKNNRTPGTSLLNIGDGLTFSIVQK